MDEEPFEGVEIDTPAGSIRVGRGRGWADAFPGPDEEYRRARRRVRRVLGFYRHLATFITLNLIILAFDLAIDPDDFFVQWVVLFWGVVLGLHFLNVFVFDALFGREAERRLIERELRRRQGSAEPPQGQA